MSKTAKWGITCALLLVVVLGLAISQIPGVQALGVRNSVEYTYSSQAQAELDAMRELNTYHNFDSAGVTYEGSGEVVGPSAQELAEMTTEELALGLLNSEFVMADVYSSSPEAYAGLVENNPYVQELCSRSDYLAVLSQLYDDDAALSERQAAALTSLLSCVPFQSGVTEAEFNYYFSAG